MERSSERLNQRRGPWRVHESGHARRRNLRFVKRGLLTSIALGLLGLFAATLLGPLFHLNTHLVLVTAEYPASTVPPIDYLDDSRVAFEELKPALFQDETASEPTQFRFATPAEMDRLGGALRGIAPRPTDVAILYVAAHGITYDGESYLLCENVTPSNLLGGLYPLVRLLRQLALCDAGTKLLILEAGSVEYDPRLGVLLNDFPTQLRSAAQQQGDPSIWILNANSTGERSHRAPGLGKAVFTHFVQKGLRGDADLDQDRTVDVGELHRYVAVNVGAWVSQYSAGSESQTVELIWSGGPGMPASPFPVLISVTPFDDLPLPDDPDASGEPMAGRLNGHGHLPLARRIAAAGLPRFSSHRGAAIVGGAPSVPWFLQAAVLSQAEEEPATPVPDEQADPPTEAEPEAPAESEGDAEADEPVPPSDLAADRLREFWELRDQLESRAQMGLGPLDTSPQLWRVLIARLTQIEQLFRGGRESQAETALEVLRRAIEPLQQPLGTPSQEPRTSDDLGRRIARGLQQQVVAVDSPHSLALALLTATVDDGVPQDRMRSLVERLAHFGHGGGRDEFLAWTKQLTDEEQQFFEIQLAILLAGRADISWGAIQAALQARLLGERVAAVDPRFLRWVRDLVERADRLRFEGERNLLNGVGPTHTVRAADQLRQAAALYRQASDDTEVVRAAHDTANDLVFRAPGYLRLRRLAASSSAIAAPDYEDIQGLLFSLDELVTLLDQEDAGPLEVLASTLDRCARYRRAAEVELTPARTVPLIETPGEKATAWKIDRLLSTSLLGARDRHDLLLAAAPADAAFLSRFVPPSVERTDAARFRKRFAWDALREQCQLEVALIQLAAGDLPAADRALLAVQEGSRQLDERTEGTSPTSQRALHELAAAVHAFYRELPDYIEDTVRQNESLEDRESRPQRLRNLRAAQRALAIVDPRDGIQIEIDPADIVRRAQGRDLLVWQMQRFQRAQAFAEPAELPHLRSIAQGYRQQALKMPGQPVFDLPVLLPLSVTLPDRLSLADTPEKDVPIDLRNSGSEPINVWLVLQYDPDLMAVDLPPERTVYIESTSAVDLQERQSPDVAARPTLVIPAGGSRQLLARARRKIPSANSVRLVVKAIAAPAGASAPAMFSRDAAGARLADVGRGTLLASQAYLRRTTGIELPAPSSISVRVDGTAGSWTRNGNEWVLHPFPNRQTDYDIRLVNDAPQAKTVSVRILAPTERRDLRVTEGALDPQQTKSLVAALSPAREIPAFEMELPPAGEPVPVPFPPLAEAAEGEAESSWTVDDRVFWLITDKESGRTTVQQMRVRPQRPRRYVRPRVTYNLAEERIEIQVAARDPALVPPDGIRVRAEFGKPLPAGTQTKLEDVIQGPQFEARLYADVARGPNRVVQVYLHVDDFPRSFVYQVRCDVAADAIPEETNRRSFRVVVPQAGTPFPAPTAAIPVEFQLDAPVGSFENGNDLVEIGIDQDLDREFRGDPTTKLYSDRQTRVTVHETTPEGILRIATEVGDYRTELPAGGLQNVHVNVLGRLFAGGQETWSEPVKIHLDATPPRITEIDLRPGRTVVAAAEIEVAVGATDGAAGGVDKVEVALDVAGSGEFSAEVPPVEAESGATLRWMAKVATSDVPPGSYTLLVRATDAVGNTSEYSTVPGIRIVTAAMAEQLRRSQTNRVLGIVRFGNDPAPNIKMTLTPVEEDAPPVPTVQSNEDGEFVFPTVPPGDYILTGEGKVRNGGRVIKSPTREDFLEVSVAPAPAPPIRLEVEVR